MENIDFHSITFRQLVEYIKDYIGDAPVHFTPIDKLDKTDYVSCRFMGNEEADAIRHGKHNTETQFDNRDVGIHLPDITIKQLFCLESQRNPAAQRVILADLNAERILYNKERQLWFALFCILHEVGHWKYFIQSGLSAFDYEKSEHEIRDKFEKIAVRLYEMPDFLPEKMTLAEQYHKESHAQIPSEKAADEYALKHFDNALTKVRKALGYDEEWLSVHWRL